MVQAWYPIISLHFSLGCTKVITFLLEVRTCNFRSTLLLDLRSIDIGIAQEKKATLIIKNL